MWKSGYRITEHVLNLKSIFDLKPNIDESGTERCHELITLNLFMTDHHKRCFSFIKEHYSKEDLMCTTRQAAMHTEDSTDKFEEGKDGQITRVRTQSDLDHLELPKKRRKSDVHQKGRNLNWLWIVMNQNIASRI